MATNASYGYTSLADNGRVWRCRFPIPFDGGGYLYVTVKAWTKPSAWAKAIQEATKHQHIFMVPAKPHCTRLKSKEDR